MKPAMKKLYEEIGTPLKFQAEDITKELEEVLDLDEELWNLVLDVIEAIELAQRYCRTQLAKDAESA